MKLPLLLSSLLLSASPVVADDSLHLQCETNLDVDVFHAETSNFIKNDKQVKSMVFRIDFIDKTLQGVTLGRKEPVDTYDIEVANDRLAFSGAKVNVHGKSKFQWTIALLPPFDVAAKGIFISSKLPIVLDMKIQGDCKKADPSVFENALKESQS